MDKRSEYGNSRYNLGMDEEDISTSIKSDGITHKNLPMPTESTCDKQRNEDGNIGKRVRFLKTVKS